jgi:hypothetical protein
MIHRILCLIFGHIPKADWSQMLMPFGTGMIECKRCGDVFVIQTKEESPHARPPRNSEDSCQVH